MRRQILLIVTLVLSVLPSATGQSHRDAAIRRLDGSRLSLKDADSFAKKTLEAARVAGTQIVILDRGKLVWSAAYGLRGLQPGQSAPLPMERETTTWAASITKAVFATYVMQLVERGEFDLDTPVIKQLPQALDKYEPYQRRAADLVQDPAWPTVTPRMLLSHSAGLANFAALEPDKKMHFHFKPGTQFQYSGEGINLVQFVIEQRLQRPLDQLMQEAIFAPLGMAHTGLIYRREFEANVADRFDADGKVLGQTRRTQARAAGSMTASAEDLARFASALLAGKILKKSSRREMTTPVVKIRSLRQFGSHPNDPESKDAAAVGLAYGLGWGLLTHTRFGPAFFKEGHGDGAQNYMICFERRQICMILLTNSDNGEFAFRPLLETILGDDVTPWEWEGYTPAGIAESRKHQ
jgi:CubicO group peptidase (beta-lactamase class C family)